MDQPLNTTPGPWDARGYMVKDCAKAGSLCIVVSGGTDADAKLVAAAPELYDALAALVEAVNNVDGLELYDSPEHLGAIAVMRRAGWTK